ncbi:conserved hypothetical protein [Desulfamplus magnetovallimortis]|uniref:AAA-ATPase-like domain-containing protein n=1 Tax=Desulfamplus magnetovallimortis TaxID=1246637 RepID=A0A1W1HII4_9BACT|nr:ATP-binding protein [Desulfamplus magnetovallimortis]SLM32327.1 conserved hypothetical protein [Desulfamplus magnetovallimortis]
MKNLPLGMNTLAKLIKQNCVYVDKTQMAWQLICQPGAFFLSRPRRFGKSLFVDTLKEIFEGNKPLFKGLYIHDKWDWTQSYPVIKIDFSDGTLQTRESLDRRIYEILFDNATRLNVTLSKGRDIPGTFGELIRFSAEKYGTRAVVLVDEYDKPILDNIENRDTAKIMREGVKNLYSVLKGQDAYLQFIFMTGVTKFSKVSLFSGVNQLTDITIDAQFGTLCGYTHHDLQTHFSKHLDGIEQEEIKQWYNGYYWLGETTVYNPYDILLFINKRAQFRNYWFETGNPSFLIKLFQKNRYFLPDLESPVVTEEILDSFDIEKINPLTLLFQSGYLTVAHTFTRRRRMMFLLKVPNLEVRIALNDHFINGYTDLVNEKIGIQDNLYTCLENGDIDGMLKVIQRLFKSIPWRNFTNNDLADFEGYYASVIYAFFCSLDAEVIPEDIDNHGQVDMTVKLGDQIYVMEIKVVDGTNADKLNCNPALKQIQDKGYADKYRGIDGVTVHEVGLVFSKASRNLIVF